VIWQTVSLQNTVCRLTGIISGSIDTKERGPSEVSLGLFINSFYSTYPAKNLMDFWNESSENKYQLTKFLRENNLEFSFNSNPEKYISRSLSPTKLTNFLKCPKCFFDKNKKELDSSPEIKLSNSIHYITDYLNRNSNLFPKSKNVLDLINFSEGNLLEALKTDEENKNYEILEHLAQVSSEEQKKIIKGVLLAYGTAKRLGFEEVRKRDSISLNLINNQNKISTTLYAKPDFTGRHITTLTKHNRKFDNFLIDYKLNFSELNKSNSIQTSIYFITHILSNRKINHYYIQDLTTGKLYELEKINPKILIDLINKFLILKNINYRGKNSLHLDCIEETSLQTNFLTELEIKDYGNSFGSQTYKEALEVLEILQENIKYREIGNIVTEFEVKKVIDSYPIKFD